MKKFFCGRKQLQKHIAATHDNPGYSCRLCGKIFKHKNYLKHHIDSVHEGKRKFSCEYCGTTFAHKEGMNCHIRTVHEGIRYQCDFCAKSFTQKPHLKSHLSEAHNQGKY